MIKDEGLIQTASDGQNKSAARPVRTQCQSHNGARVLPR